jgi:ABC-type taurine transport system substrate-binding protein
MYTGTCSLQSVGFISTDPMMLVMSTKSERCEPMNVGISNEQPPVLSPRESD